ncbi:HMG-box DNA-binding family protein isoform 1 [Tripterygium wilfordii]|uniref:HMG-box DNA-binding family protein isoform 1 n=1 Tax=Tripterygium wilfordii TaxID=458696 RepID=A0A7J7CQF0_TRIWF|nr:high mobility group B protein 14-like [Tripterygium wilfordii]KAF5736317.1 HMG-box DNA-binding family protein isoform 1 [Tripterygium wilfordii]
MAKEAAPKANKFPSSSASFASVSAGTTTTATDEPSNQKMVLRVRSNARKWSVSLSEKEEEHKTTKKRKTTQKKKIDKFDAKKPKKPPTAFFYFLEDFRKEFQEQNPGVKSMRDIGKACGEKWKIMTYEEKVQYYDIATVKRAEFDRAMADYVKRQEIGDYEEEGDSDSEWDE